MIAVDTNILVYAHRAECELHGPAYSRVTQLAIGTRPWAIPVFCIGEFLRVVTHRSGFSPPSSLPQAMGFIRSLAASPSCRVALPHGDFLHHLELALRESDAKGNLVHHAQIAALCHQHGIETILTNDRDFNRFPDLTISRLGAGA